ncbi:MAG: endonuclease [Clostridia bacterium]|nr:endonuclease [Clostridia bacterium]
MMKKLLKLVCGIVLALVAVVVVLLGVLTVAEYRPKDTESVLADHSVEAVFQAGEPMTLVSWNIGYGALGDNADFFMDGGSSVYTADRERVTRNLEGIRDELSGLGADIVFLQETDVSSSRSYSTDQRPLLKVSGSYPADAFAYNFNSLYVPYPVPPIGHVESGLYTLSRADIRQADRIQLPCPFSWPVRVVNLKRCLLVSRIPLKGSEKELVLINLHLEAYDDGTGKIEQTKQLLQVMQAEVAAGNYVIAGGDFNQTFSGVDLSAYPQTEEGGWMPGIIDQADFGDGYTLLMDPRVPTCRSLKQALAGADPDHFQYYVIDGFIVSDNVRVDSCETQDLRFVCSDHNPVKLTFTLLP